MMMHFSGLTGFDARKQRGSGLLPAARPMKAFADDEKQTAEDGEDEGEDEHVGGDFDEQDERGLQDTSTVGDRAKAGAK